MGLALVVISFFAGIGIAAIGPGGIFVTIALFMMTTETPATIAGTASATFIATGILGTASYYRSGELSSRSSMVLGGVLSGAGLIGALIGVMLNAQVSAQLFGMLLGGFVSITGLLMYVRERLDVRPTADVSVAAATGVGLFIGIASGMLGVGGPVIAVPVLVLLGMPFLLAVGVAQVQSIFIALFATAGYAAQGSVSLSLAALIGIPQLAGVFVGWKVAHRVDEERLKKWLAIVLLIAGPYIAFF